MFQLVSYVMTCYLNTDMCRSASLQSHESRVHLADSLKACSKPRAFSCWNYAT